MENKIEIQRRALLYENISRRKELLQLRSFSLVILSSPISIRQVLKVMSLVKEDMNCTHSSVYVEQSSMIPLVGKYLPITKYQ